MARTNYFPTAAVCEQLSQAKHVIFSPRFCVMFIIPRYRVKREIHVDSSQGAHVYGVDACVSPRLGVVVTCAFTRDSTFFYYVDGRLSFEAPTPS